MEKVSLKDIINVVNSNKKWPLILVGVDSSLFKNHTIIDADILSSELCVLTSQKGLVFPRWIKEMNIKSVGKEKSILLIKDIDTISLEEQEKFIGILKYKGVNGYNFPSNIQIVITLCGKNLNAISKKISDLSLSYIVE